MKSPLGFRGGILHYSQFRLLRLSSKRLRLPNPFFQFRNRPFGGGSEAYIRKTKLELKVKVKELNARNNEHKSIYLRKKGRN